MNNLDTFPETDKHTDEGLKRKKLWRNLFILNLCVTLLLIALFWIPIKVAEMERNNSGTDAAKPEETARLDKKSAEPTIIPDMLETREVLLNASSEKEWTYFDFSRSDQVKIFDRSSLEWDLAFRRAKVLSNSGASNKIGKAGLLDLGEVDFDRLTEVPKDNYVQDTPTRTEPENTVMLKWYKYNYLNHKLSPKNNVYAVRTADNKFAKIQFLSFYCANNEPGCIKMRYVYQDNGSNSFLKEPALTTASTHGNES